MIEHIISQARQHAKRGHSRNFTAQLLGMSPQKLRRLADGYGIQFVNGHQSLARKKALTELHEANKGGRSVTEKTRAALIVANEKRCTRYTAFGVTGLLRELKERFGCKLKVQSIRDRIRAGMSPEEALTVPHRKPARGVIPSQFAQQIAIQQRRAAAGRASAIAHRLTPTMLQFRAPEHSIVVTDHKDAYITIEVRKAGATLHRLRFVSSFKSGVLFSFSSDERWGMDFIAFEPNSEALVAICRESPQ